MHIQSIATPTSSQNDINQVGIRTFNYQPRMGTPYLVSLGVGCSDSKWFPSEQAVLVIELLKFEVHEVPFGDKMLIRRKPTTIPVTKSECGNYFSAEPEDLEVFIWAESVEELEDAFDFMLEGMWEDYVMEDRAKMGEGALKIRDRLKKTYRCV